MNGISTPIRILTGLSVAGLVVTLTGCTAVIPGPAETRSHAVSDDVHGVRLDSYGDLEVRIGDEPGLEVRASARAHDRLEFDESNGILEITMDGGFGNPGSVEFVLTVTDLDTIDLRGVGDIDAEFGGASDVEITVAGAGDLDAEGIDAETVRAELKGVGDISLSGRTDALDVRVSGAGSADVSDLRAAEAQAVVAGVGSIELWASDHVDAQIRGAGDIRVSGGARIDRTIEGIGEIIED